MTHAVPLLDKNDRCSLIFADGETIVFEPLFGYAQYIPLPDSKRKVCNLSELTDAALGRNVKDVLANSRVLDRSEIDAFFDDAQVARWVKKSGEIMFRLAHKKKQSYVLQELDEGLHRHRRQRSQFSPDESTIARITIAASVPALVRRSSRSPLVALMRKSVKPSS